MKAQSQTLLAKTLLAALAGVALLTAPAAAQAQHHGGDGFHGGGGFHGGAGFHSGGFRGGGFHGGFHEGGFHDGDFHGFHHGFGFRDRFFYGAGFGLGLGFYDPWFWGYPAYGYYGYPIYYGYPVHYEYDYDYDDAPSSYYRGSLPGDDAGAPGAPSANAQPPADAASAPAAKACGTWRWDATAQKYQWDTTGC